MFALYPQQRSALAPPPGAGGSGTRGLGVGVGVRVGVGEGVISGSDGVRYDDDYAAGGGAGGGGGGGVQASLVASDVVQVSLSEPLDVVGGTVTTHAL